MKEALASEIQKIVQGLFSSESKVVLTRPEPKFGDFSTNVAMQLGGKPAENAAKIVEKLKGIDEVSDASVAGPGFINITLSTTALIKSLDEPISKPFKGQKVVIETNNPNPFKDIHIGHAMNAIVADTIANLLEVGGGEVHRVSYHGDIGLHVACSLWAILDELGDKAPEKLKSIPESERPKKLREWYARGAGLLEEDPVVKEAIEALVPKTFSLDDPLIKEVYELCKKWSFDYFDKVFADLGSHPTERRYLESEADEEGRRLVETNIGKIFEKSEGAVVFKGEKYGLHTRVFIASRGTTLYETRDLGLMVLKDNDFGPEMSYIITAEEQREYFKVVLKAAELANPKLAGKTTNISTGTVKLTTGKMSSRTGNVVNISWLFDELNKAVKARGASGETVELSSLAALRYVMLKNRLTSDTVLDVENSVSLEGNTGPYLQYAYARAQSLLAKATKKPELAADLEDSERNFVRKLTEFSSVVDTAVNELMPHHICGYLYELAQVFNSFYEHNRVIGEPREATRVWAIGKYAEVLKQGLTLLGIAAPDHM